MFCTQCGLKIQEGWRVCPSCGMALPTAPGAAAGRDIGIAPTAASAQDSVVDVSPFYQESWAVVVGIDNYQHEEVPNLEFAVADAQLIARTLPQLGFRADRIVTLLNEQATQRNIQKALSGQMVREPGPNDRLLVFFSGHGQDMALADGATWGYLIPSDGDPEELHASCISMLEVADSWSKMIPAKHILYVLDCCYSGLAGARSTGLSRKHKDWLASVTSRSVRQIITAGRGDQQAFEENGHGIFTRAFVQAVTGDADLEGRGFITGQELGNYVRTRVQEESRHQQDPLFRYLRGEGEFIFGIPGAASATPPAVVPPPAYQPPPAPAPPAAYAPPPPAPILAAPPPPASAAGSLILDKNALASMLRQFDYEANLVVQPEIKAKRLGNATVQMRIGRDDEIVGLVDTTVMNSGKEGVAFGLRALYYNAGEHGSPPGGNAVPYGLLASSPVGLKENHSSVVAIGDQYSFLSLINVETMLAMVRGVQALTQGRPGICPTCGLDDQWDGQRCGHCDLVVGVPDPPPDIALPVEILVDILGPLRGGGVDLYPNLPGKKVRNAMSRFGIRPDEQLVLLYDSNLLSKSMKNGMAFGLRGIYFDRGEYFTTDGPNCLPYGTFPACRFRPKPYSRIEFRSGMSYQFLNQLAMMRALNAIKECVMRGL